MNTRPQLAACLATAFLDGDWTRAVLTQRGNRAAYRPKWLRKLVRAVLRQFPERPADPQALRTFLDADLIRHPFDLRLALLSEFAWPPVELPPTPWKELRTAGRLAEWLGLSAAELDWFADCRGRNAAAPDGPLRHYRYLWRAKRGGRFRLLEIPKARLKEIQRRLLAEILDRIPPHPAAHGFRRGRSVLSYAAPHVGKRLVLRLDLRDFFPSIQASRVHALFRSASYSLNVARLLTGLCTNIAPSDIGPIDGSSATWLTQQLYSRPHLPQGAPTSPALANLCAFKLDCRLSKLAETVGAAYTRYADDLAFSGDADFARGIRRFHVQVCAIALAEGFEVHTRKSRFMRRGVRQQLAGVVVNAHANIGRDEFDQLKATLHNCARLGPARQNRAGVPNFRAHLLGRIAYVAMLNPQRGRKLHDLFERIRWEG